MDNEQALNYLKNEVNKTLEKSYDKEELELYDAIINKKAVNESIWDIEKTETGKSYKRKK